MRVRVTLQMELDLDIDLRPETTPADLMALAAPAAQKLLAGDSILVRGDDFVLAPHEDRQTSLATWLRGLSSPLKLHQVERCMHSSPAVPGKGFLCGWC
jgi:hypothetical protein